MTPWLVLLILMGPFAGSFAAVLADRLPRGEDWVRARSACRACGRGLGLRDLVPILSFAMRRGRCGHCGAAIPGWLWLAEIAGGGIAVLAALAAPTAGGAWAGAVAGWLCLALVLTDLTRFRLPDLLTGALAVWALVLSLAGIGPAPSPGMALLGAALGAGSFALLRRAYRGLRGREGLGAGDVRLMIGLGALVGPWALPWLTLLAATAALGVAATRALTGGGVRALRGTRPLPFGAALAAAGWALWLAAAAGAALPV